MQLNRIMAEYYRTSEKSVPKQDAKWLMEMLEREFRSLVEWLYHSLQVAETQEAAFEEWDRLTGWAVERRNRSRAEQLLELARQLTEESEPYLSSSTAAYGRYLIRYTKFLVQEAHLEDARKLLEQARQIFEKVNSSSNLAICFNNIGGIFQIQGKSDQALRYYEQAIQLDPTNVVFRKNRDNLSKSYQGSEGHQWRSSPISRTSVFILGNPGSGKSTAAHMIQMFARDYGWESTLFQDYPILNEMFHADTKVPRFKPTEHGGFDVLDWSVLDEALRILENKVQQFRANLSYERKTLITIEFSRSDYRHAFLNFSPDFLHDTHFLFLDTDIEVCKQRIYERIINPKYEDDVFVSERVFEDYYRNDNRSYMIFGLKQDFHIDDRQVTVIDNTGTQEYLYKQVRSLIDPLFEGWGDITQNEEPLIL